MDAQALQRVVQCFFQRAIVAVSYSAADRFARFAAVGQGSAALAALVLTGCALLLTGRNACRRTTLASLLSKLLTSHSGALLPMEEAQTSYLILPSLALYYGFCAVVCGALGRLPMGAFFTANIVPYVVIFCTARIMQVIQRRRQQHFLYFLVLVYPVCARALPPGLVLFVQSLMSQGVLLIVQKYIFGSIQRADIALSFFYMCILACAQFLFARSGLGKQWDLCLGVLMYNFSRHLLHAMQAYCSNRLVPTFAVTVALVILLLYQRRLFPPTTTEFCVNSLSILWGALLDAWIARFHPRWEPLFIYFFVFALIQHLRDNVRLPDDGAQCHREIVLIASESEGEKRPVLDSQALQQAPRP